MFPDRISGISRTEPVTSTTHPPSPLNIQSLKNSVETPSSSTDQSPGSSATPALRSVKIDLDDISSCSEPEMSTQDKKTRRAHHKSPPEPAKARKKRRTPDKKKELSRQLSETFIPTDFNHPRDLTTDEIAYLWQCRFDHFQLLLFIGKNQTDQGISQHDLPSIEGLAESSNSQPMEDTFRSNVDKLKELHLVTYERGYKRVRMTETGRNFCQALQKTLVYQVSTQ